MNFNIKQNCIALPIYYFLGYGTSFGEILLFTAQKFNRGKWIT